jgi:hypothetical protein
MQLSPSEIAFVFWFRGDLTKALPKAKNPSSLVATNKLSRVLVMRADNLYYSSHNSLYVASPPDFVFFTARIAKDFF